ncbi:hypothetical protein PG985_014084 [Apiospora marii]|uniref:uncharacterized protein n=1 Tax=Apiospora marii TaxID=335849 RepID=UPI00312D6E41
MELAKAAKESIKDVTPARLEEQAKEVRDKKKGKKPTKPQVQAKVRTWIAQQFPAYTQLFGAAMEQGLVPDNELSQSWGAPQLIHDRLEKLLKNIGDPDAIGSPIWSDLSEDKLHWHRNKHPLYITRHENPERVNGDTPCEGGTQAFTDRASEMRDFETGQCPLTHSRTHEEEKHRR